MPAGKKFGGREKGTPNKTTALAREAIARFVDGNAENLQGWLELIAKDNPAKAFELFMSVVEYHIPKLARTEHAGGLTHTHRNASELSDDELASIAGGSGS